MRTKVLSSPWSNAHFLQAPATCTPSATIKRTLTSHTVSYLFIALHWTRLRKLQLQNTCGKWHRPHTFQWSKRWIALLSILLITLTFELCFLSISKFSRSLRCNMRSLHDMYPGGVVSLRILCCRSMRCLRGSWYTWWLTCLHGLEVIRKLMFLSHRWVWHSITLDI